MAATGSAWKDAKRTARDVRVRRETMGAIVDYIHECGGTRDRESVGKGM